MPGDLYIVSTPIGNLKDISHRALTILSDVDIIACEDTRVSNKLLTFYKIKNKLIVYNDYNERKMVDKVYNYLLEDNDIALISDAGTPCISDPGYRIVNLANKEDIEVVAIPGPSSVTAALSIAGIPTDHFYFEGFLPPKKGRKTRFELLESLPATIVIFESPQRVIRTLNDIHNYWGDRIISVCRELTKMYEESFLGTVSDALEYFSKSNFMC